MKPNQRAILAWWLYDWGSSAFPTVVMTFVYATYFVKAVAPGEVEGTVLWSRGIAASALVVALLSPFLGAVADRSGRRRPYLALSMLTCILATGALAFISPAQPHAVWLALGIVAVANVAADVAMVFYNALLPSLASPSRIGRVSGIGWGLGYLGGLACMAVGLLVLVREAPLFGIGTAEGFHIRATNLLAAGWFLIFGLPLLFAVRESGGTAAVFPLRGALTDLARTFRQVRRYRETAKFLLARFLYNDGVATLLAFGGIYAAGTFDMEISEVLRFGLALNLVAGLGALAFGFVDDRIGGKRTLQMCLAALTAATLVALVATTKTWFWAGGLLIGILIGPVQATSRSLMARFVPARHQTELFGFYELSGKLTSFLGPAVLGIVTAASGSQRTGLASVLVFFVLGSLVLGTVDEQRGIEVSRTLG